MASINQLLRQAEEYLQIGLPHLADPLLGRILDQDPRNCRAMLHRAQLFARTGKLPEAQTWLGRVLEIDPDHPDACMGMAAIGLNSGNSRQAAEWFQKLHALRPNDPVTLYNLALSLYAMGNKEEAIAAYRKAIVLKPDYVQANNNLGNILLRDGILDEAMQCYRQAIAVQPSLVEAHYNLGLVLKKLKRPDEATKCFQQTLRLQPDHAQALFSLGAILHEKGVYQDAIPWYKKAIQADPDYVEAYSNLGLAYQLLGSFQAAIDEFLVAIRICNQGGNTGDRSTNPAKEDEFAEMALDALYYNLGYIYKQQGRLRDWFENFQAFEGQHRDSLHYVQYGHEVAFMSGDFERSDAFLRELIEHEYKPAEFEQLSQLLSEIQYYDTPQDEIMSLYRQFHELAMQETDGRQLSSESPGHPGIGQDGRRIRVGYISPDFNRHVMGLIMVDVLSRHDRERFDIYCYALGKKEDEITAKVVELSDRFVRIEKMNSLDAARLIAADELDILVDLAGLTDGANPMILAYKPAPLQITHLGYHGSLGLGTVDFKITDRYADLPENEQYMMEGLLPMEGCVMPLHHQGAAPDGPTRAELGIAEDSIVFGEFVNIKKLSPRCLETWRLILDRLDNAVIAFSPFHVRDHESFLKRTSAAGIPAERVKFIPAGGGLASSRTRYRLLDIVLDTSPYSGGDTTMSALDMAVPVVTLCGTRQSERMSYSILKHLGLDECIAQTQEEYVDIACRLARDHAWRHDLADRIPRLLHESGMDDMTLYTANLEQAYLHALRLKGLAVPPRGPSRSWDGPASDLEM